MIGSPERRSIGDSEAAIASGPLLGIDLGGTKVAFALGEASGAVRARFQRPTAPSGDPERDLAAIVADARGLLARAGLASGDLAGIGVSAPGPIDRARRALVAPPNLPGWSDVPLASAIERALGRPVHLENDANAAALAEWRFGAGRGAESLAYLTLSTGIGAGLVLGGRLHAGTGGSAGEVGHVPVEWDGEPCVCGRRGCLEAYAGGSAWTARLRRVTPAESGVAVRAGGPEAVTPVELVAAARDGDAFARGELARWVEYVARGVAALVATLDPEVVVLGTIAAAAGEELAVAPIRARVNALAWPAPRSVRIVPAALGERLPELAGLCVALEAMRDDGGASPPS